MLVSVKWIIILHLLRYNKKPQRDQVKSLHREFVAKDVRDSLSAETLLAEMFCENGSRHLFQISHFVNRNPAADYFFHIGRCDSLCCPHFIPAFFLLIMLIKSGDNLFCMIKQSRKFLECLAFLGYRIYSFSLQFCKIIYQLLFCIQTEIISV